MRPWSRTVTELALASPLRFSGRWDGADYLRTETRHAHGDNTGACPDGPGGTCRPAACGDGSIRAGHEDCDGTDLNEATRADLPGWEGGDPACGPECSFDVSGCCSCSLGCDWVAISAYWLHSCGIKRDGTAWNKRGQLGNGTLTDYHTLSRWSSHDGGAGRRNGASTDKADPDAGPVGRLSSIWRSNAVTYTM